MKHKRSRFWMSVLIALPLALMLGACSDDDDDKITDPLPPAEGACCLPDGSCEVMTQTECVTGGGVWQGKDTVCDPNPCEGGAVIPGIPGAEIVQEVDFGSTDPNATAAQQIVQAQLEAAASITQTVGEILSPLRDADWDSQGGGCYTWSDTEEGCTWTYTVCEDATGLEWTLMLDGDCAPEQDPFDDWVVIRGWSNVAGTSGWFKFYDYASGNVLMSWTWDVDAESESGTWDFYLGDPLPENLWARMTWEELQDGSQRVEWLMVNMIRWEMEVSADGTEGWMKQYMYDSDHTAWRLTSEIVWHSDGTGSHTMYDHEGNPVSVETW